MEKPAAEKKCQFFSILHEEEEEEEEEEENSRLREGPESSSGEPLDERILRRMAQSRESSRTFRLRKKRIPCENSTIKKEGSSSQEKSAAAAGVVLREVMSFTSPFPFFWTSMQPSKHLLAEVTNADSISNVLLQNEEGLSWEVLIRPNGHSYTFSTGWKDFAIDNKLEIGDCVIFELIDRLPDSTIAMSFHICRIPVPVPSLVPAQISNGPEKECFSRVPSSPLARETKRGGRACESLSIREGGSDNHEKSAAALQRWNDVRSFSSPFPFFWTCMKPSNVGMMSNIPVAFAREHLSTNVKSGEEKMDVMHIFQLHLTLRQWPMRSGTIYELHSTLSSEKPCFIPISTDKTG
ncbi:hypothetical protein MKX03_016627 [Papaver bracteatum]|nr:hypothetical protein MKX03_016627 [Papaver bracteatum]